MRFLNSFFNLSFVQSLQNSVQTLHSEPISLEWALFLIIRAPPHLCPRLRLVNPASRPDNLAWACLSCSRACRWPRWGHEQLPSTRATSSRALHPIPPPLPCSRETPTPGQRRDKPLLPAFPALGNL